MTDQPEPLVPPDVDLSKLDGFMLDTVKLLGSELVALSTGDEFKAAVLLWARSWKQRPACSLPDDDRILASFAMCPLQKWRKVKDMALRGWVKCSDGRLYHRVLSVDALRAHKAAEQRRQAIAKRWGKGNEVDTAANTEGHTGNGTGGIRPNGRPNYETDTIDGTGRDGTKEERKKEYRFSGKVVRLTEPDFEGWRKAYPTIPDLDAELTRIDDSLSAEGKGKGWFPAASAMLSAKHQRNLERQQKDEKADKSKSLFDKGYQP